MIIIRAFFVISVLINSLSITGQNTPSFNHYIFNPTSFNMGVAANTNLSYVSFQHRSQWVGYNNTFDNFGDAPSSQLVTMVIPLQAQTGYINALGGLVSLDRQGAETTARFQIGVAKRFDLKKGLFAIGITSGLISRTLNFSQFRFENPNEPLAIGTRESQTSIDFSVGIFYQSYSGVFLGGSVDHVFSPTLIQVQTGEQEVRGKLDPLYYVIGGQKLNLNTDLDLTASSLVRTNFQQYSIDFSGIITYRSLMWVGTSYRHSESIVLLIGYNFLEEKQLKVGYSFDYVVKNQQAKRPTSHEIFIQYNLPSLTLGGRKPVKTPRFSF